MKKWNTPTVEELAINETAHKWVGITRDGGYIGDGIISGHLDWTCDSNNNQNGNSSTEPSSEITNSLS